MLARAFASLPSQCELCRGWGEGLVCRHCIAQHARPRPRCLRCAQPLGEEAPACGACLREPPPFVRTVCALDYGFPWDRVIATFKFQRRIEFAAPLAALLQSALDAAAPMGQPPAAAPTCVVPVPLTRSRLAERGFNQAWELARRIARRRGLRAERDALRRVLDTSPQAALATQVARQHNLRNAFAPAPGASLAGDDVALVDDVMTTGATAGEAAAALLRGGARSVQLWVLARTP